MFKRIGYKIWNLITQWLTEEAPLNTAPLSDFDRLRYEIRFCDVILVEGRSRVSTIIQSLTLSPWTHSALYIGRLHAIDDPDLRDLIQRHYPAEPDEQLIIEALLGQGTIVAPLSKYRGDHLRICRPVGLSRKDSQTVVAYAASKLGAEYDIRQLLDLARFLFPYRLLPRRWLSSLFGESQSAKTVCSTMLAEAFTSIRFPVRPFLHKTEDGEFKVFHRNLRLYAPSDFDHSPYFDIIKYPIYGIESPEIYRSLPWDTFGVALDDYKDINKPAKPGKRGKKAAAAAATEATEKVPSEPEDDLDQEAKNLLEDVEPEKQPAPKDT